MDLISVDCFELKLQYRFYSENYSPDDFTYHRVGFLEKDKTPVTLGIKNGKRWMNIYYQLALGNRIRLLLDDGKYWQNGIVGRIQSGFAPIQKSFLETCMDTSLNPNSLTKIQLKPSNFTFVDISSFLV